MIKLNLRVREGTSKELDDAYKEYKAAYAKLCQLLVSSNLTEITLEAEKKGGE